MPDLDSLEDLVRAPVSNQEPLSMQDLAVMPPQESAEDSIVAAVRDDDVPDTLLKAVVYGFAEEQASLRAYRMKRERQGVDTSQLSLKRSTILKYMSETVLQKQALAGMTGDLDFRGPKFREVFKMFLETVSDTIDEVKIPAEFKEMFFHALSRNLDGWESKAEKMVKRMTPRI
jgi:hypothetical protein